MLLKNNTTFSCKAPKACAFWLIKLTQGELSSLHKSTETYIWKWKSLIRFGEIQLFFPSMKEKTERVCALFTLSTPLTN